MVKGLLFLFFFGLLGAQVGKEKGQTPKLTNPFNPSPLGFDFFVVFGILGTQVGKEKGTDNKNSKS